MLTEPILIEEGLNTDHAYLISHLGIMKVFAIWGLLESVLYYITKGNKKKEIVCHLFILVAISLFAYAYPNIKEELK